MFLVALLAWVVTVVQAGPTVISPRPGDTLQGTVIILGTSDINGFQSYEISFSYPGGPADTWFPIASSSQALSNVALAEWDTTLISDGIYDLRLQVFLADGSVLEYIVPGLMVRNYTATETPIPSLTPSATAPSRATATPTTHLATFTPLPPNPAEFESKDVFTSLGLGALVVTGLLFLLYVYTRIRRT